MQGSLCPFFPLQGGVGMSIHPGKTFQPLLGGLQIRVYRVGVGGREETGGRSEMSKKWQSGLSEQSPGDSKTTGFAPPHGLFIQEKNHSIKVTLLFVCYFYPP